MSNSTVYPIDEDFTFNESVQEVNANKAMLEVYELITCLDCYDVLLRNGGLVFNQLNKDDEKIRSKKLQEFTQSFEKLKKIVQNNKSLNSFDFVKFHDQILNLFNNGNFSSKTDTIIDIDEALDHTLSIVTMIQFLLEKNDALHISPSGEIIESISKTIPTDQEKTTIGQKMAVGAGVTLFLVSERFNYFFKGVPTNRDEYFHLLERYDKAIKRLNIKINLLNESIPMLEQEFLALKSEKLNLRRTGYPERLYNGREDTKAMSAEVEKWQTYKDFLETEKQKHESEIMKTKKVDVDNEFERWRCEKEKYLQEYNSLIEQCNKEAHSMPIIVLDEKKKRMASLLSLLNKHYGDEKEEYARICNSVLSNDPIYLALLHQQQIAVQNFDRAITKLNRHHNSVFTQIEQDFESEYDEKMGEVLLKSDRMKREKERKEKRKDAIEKKREQLIQNHQQTFADDSYFKKLGH